MRRTAAVAGRLRLVPPSGGESGSLRPPAETAEEITYEVTTDLYEKDILADDGTLLMHISFALPQLQAYADGTLIETPTSPEQQRARQNTETFNTLFAQWKNSESTNETTDELQREYREFPDNFTGEYAISYEEDLTYDVYRTGTLISLSATYYSYLGGAHPNMVYFSWNFDLESGSFLSIPELAQDPQAFTLAVADGIEAQAADRFKAEVSDLSDIYWDNYREVMEKWGSDYAAFFHRGWHDGHLLGL